MQKESFVSREEKGEFGVMHPPRQTAEEVISRIGVPVELGTLRFMPILGAKENEDLIFKLGKSRPRVFDVSIKNPVQTLPKLVSEEPIEARVVIEL
jgi:hypothetical protein